MILLLRPKIYNISKSNLHKIHRKFYAVIIKGGQIVVSSQDNHKKIALISFLYYQFNALFFNESLLYIKKNTYGGDDEIWVGIIINGRVIASQSLLYIPDADSESYSGDATYKINDFQAFIPNLLENLLRMNRGSLYYYMDKSLESDIMSRILLFPDLKALDEDPLEFNKDSKKYNRHIILSRIHKYHRRISKKTALIIIGSCAGIYSVYHYIDLKQTANKIISQQKKLELLKQQKKIEKLAQGRNAFYSKLYQDNGSIVLKNIYNKLQSLIYLQNGWILTQLEYNQGANNIQLTYHKQDYGSVVGLYQLFDEPKKYTLDVASNMESAIVMAKINRQPLNKEIVAILIKTNKYDNNFTLMTLLISQLQQTNLDFKVATATKGKIHSSYFRKMINISVTGNSQVDMIRLADIFSVYPFIEVKSLEVTYTEAPGIMKKFNFTGIIYV